VLDESPKRGPKLAFIETGCGFLFAENHGWQWAKSFCFIAFDPGRLLFLPKWLLPNFNFHTMHNLEARGVVFDPGKLGPGQSIPQEKSLVRIYAWRVAIPVAFKLVVLRLMFDPGGLWNLSVGEEDKGAIAEVGGVKALVDLIFKWSTGGDGVLERAAGALANLAVDDKCSIEVALVGDVHALLMAA